MAVYLAFQIYYVFAVWSLCDDFLIGGIEPVFTDLLAGAGGKEEAREAFNQSFRDKQTAAEPYRGDVMSFSDDQRKYRPIGSFPAVYGSVITGGLGNSGSIFGGGLFGGLWGFSRHDW